MPSATKAQIAIARDFLVRAERRLNGAATAATRPDVDPGEFDNNFDGVVTAIFHMPRMRQAYVDALTSIEEMAAEVRAYEDLKAGRVQIRSASLAELPTVLIRARIAHGWTQKQLAAFLSVTEQTIQRYEATGYQGVALARLTRIADVLSVQVVGAYATA